MFKAIKEVKKRFPEGPPLLDPVKDMKIEEPSFLGLVKRIESLEKRYEVILKPNVIVIVLFLIRLYEHPLHGSEILDTEYEKYDRKLLAETDLADAKRKLLEAKSILQLDELKCRKRVLRRLEYCTNTDVIQVKGRVACELSR